MTSTTGVCRWQDSLASGQFWRKNLGTAFLFAFLSVLFTPVASEAQTFTATPLTEYKTGQRYLNRFSGLLYSGSNTMPKDHDADGLAAAERVQPLDTAGQPDPDGKIVVVGMGFSNWTYELCYNVQTGVCRTGTFLDISEFSTAVNHASLVLVDCAVPGEVSDRWLDDTYGNYTHCLTQLQTAGVTEAQVQVILYKNARKFPRQSLTKKTICSADSTVDVCRLESDIANAARYMKIRYPSVQQLFLHSRIYGGYAAAGSLNPEPFAYESGFAVKWLIDAQIQQQHTGVVDPTAGDVSYNAVPWMAWGPYFWASGSTSRADGVSWTANDFRLSDMTHPSAQGVSKVSGMMLEFYLSSPYSPWFRN
jgi:hypothetical protein